MATTTIDPITLRTFNPRLATYNDADRALFQRELRDFVPPDAFDAHAHQYDLRQVFPAVAAEDFQSPPDIGFDAYRHAMSQWMGDRALRDGLFFPFPRRDTDTAATNVFLADQLSTNPGSRGLMMVTPDCDPTAVEATLLRNGFAGFKVYHVYANRPDTFNAELDEFLPPWLWELAHKHSKWIMLHMVKRRAIADESNQRIIRERCVQYPNATLVLAHAARGFCGRHTLEGIASLRSLDNVIFDTSAICDSDAVRAILETCGSSRLVYGSDFGISELRGKAVTIGDGFYWMYDHNTDLTNWTLGTMPLVGLESLLAVRDACRAARLNDRDVEKVFCHNARQRLSIEPAPTGEGVQVRYEQARVIIPGGTQLLSKRPEMFAPQQWPAYYDEAIGCEVVDTDGRRFTDMSTGGILACILGYSDPDVNAAVIRRVNKGSMATLQTDDEVTLAELLCELHPWASKVRFARTGGEAMAVAVRIARSRTGRDHVAICGYHGWHDWYLAANLGDGGQLDGHLLPGLAPTGVPKALRGTVATFRYNHLDELDAAIAKHGDKLAAIVMETTRGIDPEPGFLEGVRERANKAGAKLIFDEISIGWRLTCGGAHLLYAVEPDIAVFAKTISNGFAMSAVIGNADTMQAAQDSFISSAYWTEGVGPAAGVAAVKKMMRIDVPAHLRSIGSTVMQGWRDVATKHGVPLKLAGRPEMATFGFDHAKAAGLMTLFTVRMLKHGFLANGSFNAMLAHEARHVQQYLAACDETFAELKQAIAKDDIEQRIGGPVKHSHFARLT